MTKSFSIFLAMIILFSSTLACNLQRPTPSAISVNDQAATIIALTLQEQAKNGGDVPITATFSPVPTLTKVTPTVGATATITPTYSVPMLTLREQTNCRTGPGQSYDLLFAYVKGAKREIIGYFPETNYWLIKAPESKTGQCWIWGEYADLTGSYWVVPTVTAPATATIAPPTAPSVNKWDFYCNSANGEMNITITWKDNASNETGYRIYRDGEKIVELPANSSSYSETIIVQAGQNVKYQIEVFGPSGSAMSSIVSISC